MEDSDLKLPQSVASWIVSLAISVACCAVLFVIFAGYLVDIKKNIAVENDRLEQVSQHEEQLLLEIRGLHHMVSTVPASPTPAPVSLTLPATPDAVTPANATAPANPQQVQTPATAVPDIAPGAAAATPSPAQPSTPSVPPVSVPVLTPKE